MARKSILATVAVVIAAVGALLVFMYARGADARASADVAVQQVLVSTAQVAAGEKVEDAIADGKFELAQLPASAILPGALTDTDGIADQVANAAIYPGEQLVPQKFGAAGSSSSLSIAKNQLAVSLQLTDPDRVAGFLSPGASVAIYVSDVDPEDPSTRMLLEKVTVLGVGQTTTATSTTTTDAGAETTEVIPTTILTLSVDQTDAGKVIYASKHGQLTFALLTDGSVTSPDPGTDLDNLFK
jgi:pilus assembly protein CpaB